ncbi:hypothetical protein ACFVH0_05520 [Streptomyces sp. NPDC127117]|uniref:hypothetical protein n=1 Tax=Streptomyces sp. NPDC127117 TaxID=3345368 RepID=UPI00362C0F6D
MCSGSGSGCGQVPAPSGQCYLKNASDKRCLGESASPYGGSMLMNSVCGEPAQGGATLSCKWTYSVNVAAGVCLRMFSSIGFRSAACNPAEPAQPCRDS